MPNPIPIPTVLTVYGARWCGDCRNIQRYLDSVGVTYQYIDLETDRAAQAMLDDAGYRAIPIVVAPNGTVMIEPSARDLAAFTGTVGA